MRCNVQIGAHFNVVHAAATMGTATGGNGVTGHGRPGELTGAPGSVRCPGYRNRGIGPVGIRRIGPVGTRGIGPVGGPNDKTARSPISSKPSLEARRIGRVLSVMSTTSRARPTSAARLTATSTAMA